MSLARFMNAWRTAVTMCAPGSAVGCANTIQDCLSTMAAESTAAIDEIRNAGFMDLREKVAAVACVQQAMQQAGQNGLYLVGVAEQMRLLRQREWDSEQRAAAAVEVASRYFGEVSHLYDQLKPVSRNIEAARIIAVEKQPPEVEIRAEADQDTLQAADQGKPAKRYRGKRTNAAANEKVRKFIESHCNSGKPISELTRDFIAKQTGISGGVVSGTRAWRVLKATKQQDKVPPSYRPNTVPSNIDEAIESGRWDLVQVFQQQEDRNTRSRS